MGASKSDTFKRICDDVWRDREAILTRRGGLSGEAALLRAVYWRLCNAWGETGQTIDGCHAETALATYERLVGLMLTRNTWPHFEGAPLLDELVRQYRDETAPSAGS